MFVEDGHDLIKKRMQLPHPQSHYVQHGGAFSSFSRYGNFRWFILDLENTTKKNHLMRVIQARPLPTILLPAAVTTVVSFPLKMIKIKTRS